MTSIGRTLEIVRRDGVRRLTLNRPSRRNALTPDLITALRAALFDAADDPDTTVVVINGNGPSFCAGADLHHLHHLASTGADPGEFLRDVSECFTAIENLTKPVVAVLHGHCVAGGLELALACDIVVAARGTLIGDGHVRNGLIPAAGSSVRLPRRLPEPLARRLMLTGRLMPAEELALHGFPQIVATEDELHTVVESVVEELRSVHGPAQRAVKELMSELRSTSSYLDALESESKAFDRYWANADVRSPLSDFVDGRRRN